MDAFIKDKIRVTCENLKRLSEKTVYEIPELQFVPWEYKKAGERPTPDETWRPFARFERVQGKDKHFWFYTALKTPTILRNEQLFLELITGREGQWDATNPQGLLYLNGEIVQGFDTNHRQAAVQPDTEYEILLYFYTGMIDSHVEVMMNLKSVDLPVQKLYYDLKVPYDAALCLEENEYTHIKTLKHLERACNFLDFRKPGSKDFYDGIAAADGYLQKAYYEKACGKKEVIVNYIGHTHIDVAWLWTLAQTKEKVQRSFATALQLMEQYPQYIFMSSQPQLYDYLRQEAPDLYEKVKKRVKEGRWEVEGAMWLEADCNLSSGESLIRQILFGKRFMREEFDVESHILWLPDVFGYSGALPQILRKSGVDQFVTSKISWNESNQIPYDSFLWQGIDGTEIFTYFLSAQTHKDYKEGKNHTTYAADISPEINLGTWERYQQKEYNNETVVLFGYGDGGGGPTAEMLESMNRLKRGLPGMPGAQMSRVGDFLARAEENFHRNCEDMGRTPRWVGELYLELHRGTYTSMARNKKNNRQCEFLCQEAETLAVMGKLFLGKEYPTTTLNDSWRLLLLNQFHDIIPGSSIKEVYEDSDRQYAQIREVVGKIKDERLTSLAEQVSQSGLFVYNPNSFAVTGYAQSGGKRIFVKDVPPMGWKVVSKEEFADGTKADADKQIQVLEKRIESPHYSIRFDDDMNIVSIFDKDNGREVIAAGKRGNQLCVFEDYPRKHDNWEISNYYKQKMWTVNDVRAVTVISDCGYGGYRVERKYMNSTIVQTILVYRESRRIDFETQIDWHEDHVLLKAHFPTTIHTNKATYEIQFGNLERPNHSNTSWDAAKFEVCAQKWGDLSEEGYGVSLLNDCKYGYGADGNEIAITLLKCGTYPNVEADQGLHTFTYSLYPHKDNFRQGGTIREAYLLNRPLTCIPTEGAGTLPPEYSFVSCDSENIVIETVKQAEAGDGMIVRLYDAWGKKSTPRLKFGFDVEKVLLCDLLENPIEEIRTDREAGNEVTIKVDNFEIITLRIART